MGLLDNARAFVTGGGISVGRACVELFVKEGAQVAFLDIREDRTAAVAQATGALGYVADIADRDAVFAAVNDAAEKLGGMTVLVNVASVMQGGRVVDTTEAQLDRMFAVNVKGYYWATQAVVPHMLKAGKGSLVQFGSVAATHPAWGESYGIVKASQTALAYQCAMEYAPTIRSNAVLCGWIAGLARLAPAADDPRGHRPDHGRPPDAPRGDLGGAGEGLPLPRLRPVELGQRRDHRRRRRPDPDAGQPERHDAAPRPAVRRQPGSRRAQNAKNLAAVTPEELMGK